MADYNAKPTIKIDEDFFRDARDSGRHRYCTSVGLIATTFWIGTAAN